MKTFMLLFLSIGTAMIALLTIPSNIYAQTGSGSPQGVEIYKATNINTVSYGRDWLFIQSLPTPLINGHEYEIRIVLSTTFSGSDCGQVTPRSDCIELGIDNHNSNTYVEWYTATTANISFIASGSINELNAYAWCAGTPNCTIDSYSLWDLSEIPTPSPSPSPTPIPVTKVFFIPGLGASWNANAFANCQFDTDSSHWSLAPYAEGIYNPILQAIKDTGWTLYPFYYDWRDQVTTNTSELAHVISENTQDNEKINAVGHSMGGLLGRNYLESSNGEELNSLLTLGTPHNGSALAYPPWAGGDVWNDNFLAKTAITLYLKHCGGVFSNDRETIQSEVPSVQNLLPTDAYLEKTKSDTIYLPTHPANVNNLLTQPFTNPWGIRVGTIAGTGYSTLDVIKTKDPTQKDINAGNWLDGKPNGKLYSSEGDGTVLSSSAMLPEASYSATLNQTHTGLVDSIEGMTEVLKFLGPPPSLNSQNSLNAATYSEPNSALILIGYPASFWVSDENGKIQTAKDGMVAFINPKTGSYKLSIIPKSSNTLLAVAQFLPNGEVKYKEYKLEGTGPKFKTLNFNLSQPEADILN